MNYEFRMFYEHLVREKSTPCAFGLRANTVTFSSIFCHTSTRTRPAAPETPASRVIHLSASRRPPQRVFLPLGVSFSANGVTPSCSDRTPRLRAMISKDNRRLTKKSRVFSVNFASGTTIT